MTLPAVLVALAVAAAFARRLPDRRVARRLARLSPSVVSEPWQRMQRALAAVAGSLGGVLGFVWLGPVGAVAGSCGSAWGAHRFHRLRASARERRLRSQVPEALELVAAAIRAGRSVRQALPAAAAVGAPLQRVVERASARIDVGRPVPDVLRELGEEEPAVAPACAALGLGLAAGGDVARALDRLAAATRQRLRQRDELQALTAQVRLSGIVLGALPLASLAVFTVTGSTAHAAFLREPPGQACLAAGLLLDAAGYALIKRIGQ